MLASDFDLGPKPPLYAMHWLASEGLRDLTSRKELNAGHLGVLFMLIDHMDSRGYVWLTPTPLAKVFGRADASQTIRDVGKLIHHQLIVRVYHPATNQKGYMVNPYVAHVGGIATRPAAWARFKAHLQTAKGLEGEEQKCLLKPTTIGAAVEKVAA